MSDLDFFDERVNEHADERPRETPDTNDTGRGGGGGKRRAGRRRADPKQKPQAERGSREPEERAGRRSSGREPEERAGRRSSGRRGSRRRRKRGRFLAPLAALAVLLMVIGGGGYYGYDRLSAYFNPPDYEGSGSGEITIVVSKGDAGAEVGQTLVDAGVIASVQAFENALRGGDTNTLSPGTYQLRKHMSAEAALALLFDPASRLGVQVTIREGLRMAQAFAEIASKTEIPLKKLEKAAEDTGAYDLPEYAEGELEGFLFPDTYLIQPHSDAETVIQRMVDRFKSVAGEVELKSEAEDAGFSEREIVTMASIVQAESGSTEDMAKIARVIYNRLEIGRKLQMDSTVMYALGEYGIAASHAQLEKAAASPYSTYAHEGLPPGPIVSPGQNAMKAALDPAEGDWLYFVATDPENGVTEFAETGEEFQQLKEEFERNWDGQGQ